MKISIKTKDFSFFLEVPDGMLEAGITSLGSNALPLVKGIVKGVTEAIVAFEFSSKEAPKATDEKAGK